MADARLREIERQAAWFGDRDAKLALLEERRRVGLSLSALRVLALCGDTRRGSLLALLPDARVTGEAAAHVLEVKPSTLAGWRRRGCPSEQRGRARCYDLGQIHAWRFAHSSVWATQSGLGAFAAVVAHLAGEAEAFTAICGAAALTRSRWSALGPEAREAAETLLGVLQSPDPAPRADAALAGLLPHVPSGTGDWKSEAYRVLLPLRLLAESATKREGPALDAIQQAARSVVPALKPGPETGRDCARAALAASKEALLAWAGAHLADHEHLYGAIA